MDGFNGPLEAVPTPNVIQASSSSVWSLRDDTLWSTITLPSSRLITPTRYLA